MFRKPKPAAQLQPEQRDLVELRYQAMQKLSRFCHRIDVTLDPIRQLLIVRGSYNPDQELQAQEVPTKEAPLVSINNDSITLSWSITAEECAQLVVEPNAQIEELEQQQDLRLIPHVLCFHCEVFYNGIAAARAKNNSKCLLPLEASNYRYFIGPAGYLVNLKTGRAERCKPLDIEAPIDWLPKHAPRGYIAVVEDKPSDAQLEDLIAQLRSLTCIYLESKVQNSGLYPYNLSAGDAQLAAYLHYVEAKLVEKYILAETLENFSRQSVVWVRKEALEAGVRLVSPSVEVNQQVFQHGACSFARLQGESWLNAERYVALSPYRVPKFRVVWLPGRELAPLVHEPGEFYLQRFDSSALPVALPKSDSYRVVWASQSQVPGANAYVASFKEDSPPELRAASTLSALKSYVEGLTYGADDQLKGEINKASAEIQVRIDNDKLQRALIRAHQQNSSSSIQ